MATIKGVIRSYEAAVRKAEREQQREARAAAKRFKEQQKLQEIENAQQAVADWENYVDTLQSVHKNCTESIDWSRIKNSKKPEEPVRSTRRESEAKNNLENYKPSFFDKILGRTNRKTQKLKELLTQAKENDIKDYDNYFKTYLDDLKNWESLQKISLGIENKQVNSYKDALEYFNPFSDIAELGTQLKFDFNDTLINVDLQVNSLDVIPNYELKQTSTGKLSKKNMAKSKFNELYQDHICSSAIRVSREIFAYLPIDIVRINAISKLINSKTGHLEDQPILSVIFTRETVGILNLESIDPSDSMQNFVHNMKFAKTQGFSVVEIAELEE